MDCELCGRKISAERLSVLPDTTTCVKCSAEQRRDYDPDGPDVSDLARVSSTMANKFDEFSVRRA